MKILKGIATYTVILVLIAFSLAIIACGYLFLFPTQQLFGIKYISANSSFAETQDNLVDIDTVIINGGNITIKVYPAGNITNSFEAHLYARYSGFGFADKATGSIEITKQDNQIITNVTEPKGLLSIASCEIRIYIPDTLNDNFNLIINTNKAKCFVGINAAQGQKLNVKNLTLNTNRGIFNLLNINLTGTITSDLNNGKIYSGMLLSGNVSTFNLATKSGIAYFDKIADDFILNNVIWQNSSVGRLYIKTAQSLEVSGAGGLLWAVQVGSLSVSATSTKIDIKTIVNSSSITLRNEGSVKIGETQGYVEIETNKADIQISKALSPVTINTQSGNVQIKDAVQLVSVLTKSGNIVVQFNKEAPEGESVRKALLLSNSGSITVKNVDVLVAKANNNGKIQINAQFNKIIADSQNIIQSGGGNVKVIIPSDNTTPFIIDYACEGAVDIYVGAAKTQQKGNLPLYPYGATTATVTKISVSTGTGNLYMRSSALQDII